MNLNLDEKTEERLLFAKKVYDQFLRILHWWNALCIFSLILSMLLKNFLTPYDNWKEIIYTYHIIIGYALTIGILLRIVWGVFGPHHAKFKNMLHINTFVNLIKTRKYDNSENWGHDKYAGALYIFIYFLMLYQIFSGLYLASKFFNMGPLTNFVPYLKEKTTFSNLLKEIHEIVYYISIVFILLHVFMLILHEIKRKYPVTQAMFSGFQYRKKDVK